MIRDSGEKVCLAGPDIFCNVSLKSWESVVGGKVEWSVSEELEYNRKREKKKKQRHVFGKTKENGGR